MVECTHFELTPSPDCNHNMETEPNIAKINKSILEHML
jgi:hypothetical protein